MKYYVFEKESMQPNGSIYWAVKINGEFINAHFSKNDEVAKNDLYIEGMEMEFINSKTEYGRKIISSSHI